MFPTYPSSSSIFFGMKFKASSKANCTLKPYPTSTYAICVCGLWVKNVDSCQIRIIAVKMKLLHSHVGRHVEARTKVYSCIELLHIVIHHEMYHRLKIPADSVGSRLARSDPRQLPVCYLHTTVIWWYRSCCAVLFSDSSPP